MPKQSDTSQRPTRAESVRAAAAQAFQATAGQMTRERALELADELAGAATRVRDALEELRPPSGDEVRELRAQVEALEARVKALEDAPRPRARAASSKRSGTAAKRSTGKAT